VVYAGKQISDDNGSKLFAHDAATGTRLATFDIPNSSVARSAVLDDTVIVGYGALLGGGDGGVRALSLCSNGVVDAGEECDDGNATAGDCCSPSCTFETVACDDGDACTTGDVCGSGHCAGTITTVEQIGCSLAQLGGSACGAEALPANLAKSIAKAVKVTEGLLAKAEKAAARKKTAKVDALRKHALAQMDAIGKRGAKAAQATNPAKKITPACQATLEGLLATGRSTVSGFQF